MDLENLQVALTEAFLVYWKESKGNTKETLARLDKEMHNVIGQLKGFDKDNILVNHIWQVSLPPIKPFGKHDHQHKEYACEKP